MRGYGSRIKDMTGYDTEVMELIQYNTTLYIQYQKIAYNNRSRKECMSRSREQNKKEYVSSGLGEHINDYE